MFDDELTWAQSMNCMSYIIVFYNFTFVGVITN